jgi:hypothetical protein
MRNQIQSSKIYGPEAAGECASASGPYMAYNYGLQHLAD